MVMMARGSVTSTDWISSGWILDIRTHGPIEISKQKQIAQVILARPIVPKHFKHNVCFYINENRYM